MGFCGFLLAWQFWRGYSLLVCAEWAGFDECLVVGLLDDCLYGWGCLVGGDCWTPFRDAFACLFVLVFAWYFCDVLLRCLVGL